MEEHAHDRRAARLEAVARRTRRHRGVIGRDQLRAMGCSDAWVSDRVRERVLRLVLPRVFAMGSAELTREAMWRAALLFGGALSVLSHRSAAVCWGLLRIDGPRPEITVTNRRGLNEDRVLVHRCRFAEDDVVVRDGMRVTSPMRTLLDLADVVEPAVLAEAVNQAMLRGLFDLDELSRLLCRAHGRRGVGRLRKVLAAIGQEPLDVRSRNEWRAREILIAAGVATPSMNAPIALGDGRYRYADLWFGDLRLDIEIDGPHHLLPHVAAADAVRDEELAAIGVLVVRFPEDALADPERFAADVADVLARLRAKV